MFAVRAVCSHGVGLTMYGCLVSMTSIAGAALQWLMPSLRVHLQQSWSLTGEKQCTPCRATPDTAQIVLALSAAAWDLGWFGLATVLLVGFDTMGTGELLALRRRHVL
eukprot:5229320-Pyramimonas_sp.AAC.1